MKEDRKKDIDKYIGELIYINRHRKHLSQRGLGAMLGVSGTQVSKYERGIDKFPLNTVPDLMNSLGIELEELFPEELIVH